MGLISQPIWAENGAADGDFLSCVAPEFSAGRRPVFQCLSKAVPHGKTSAPDPDHALFYRRAYR
jgi:hypothetical protein